MGFRTAVLRDYTGASDFRTRSTVASFGSGAMLKPSFRHIFGIGFFSCSTQPDQSTDAGLLCALDQSSHKESPNATPMPVATHCNGKLCAPPIWIGGIARDA